MKHIVFIVGSYYPNYSAVGYCGSKVINELKGTYKITVIAKRPRAGEGISKTNNGYNIKYINYCDVPGKSKLCILAVRAFRLLSIFFKSTSVNQRLLTEYLKTIGQINEPIDAIIPLSMPIESVLASLVYKKQNNTVLVFPYLFDNFAISNSLHRFKFNRRLKLNANLKLEREILEESDRIFAMHSLRAHFLEVASYSMLKKVHFLEHPLLSERSTFSKKEQGNYSKELNITYTGSFIKNHVLPDYLLGLFAQLNNAIDFKLNLFTVGNCNDVIETYSAKYPNRIIHHGAVSKNIANRAIENADVLVNVGEVNGKQMSSKVFEYMSLGKPIVHIEYVKDDVVSNILYKYPLAITLTADQDNFNVNKQLLEKFLYTSRNQLLSFDTVSQLFPEALPATTARLFKEEIEARC